MIVIINKMQCNCVKYCEKIIEGYLLFNAVMESVLLSAIG